MMRKCVIEGCSSKSGTPQHRGVTFHSFPLDPKIRDIWLKNCHLIDSGKSITKNNFVCSRHFRRVDFQSIKSNKFMLKKGSVPTIFPWGKVQSDGKTSNINSDSNEQQSESKSDTMESQESSTQENDSNGFQTPTKRSYESDTDEQQSISKMPKLSLNYDDLSPEMSSVSGKSTITTTPDIPHQRKTDSNPLGFTVGVKIEAQDFNGLWHTAKVIEVDSDEREVLIRFDKSRKSKTTGVEEWIPMNSSRLRQIASQSAKKIIPVFEIGEKCSARWSGPRRFPATITKILGNDTYEVLFDDGYMKAVKGHHISKIKQKSIPKSQTPVKIKSQTKKDWPLISISSLNLDELNLPDIPKDGEWCCHWVNDQPIGQEGFLTVGDHKKPTVIVEDWRLPPNWIKHMYQRSNVLGKWDVILVNPQGKRFRSKADLKQFIEELGQVYNPDVYDFSIHRRRAKDIGAYVYTKGYKPPPPPISSSQQFFAAQMQNAKNDTASSSTSAGFISPVLSEGQFVPKEDNLSLPIKLFEEDKKPTLEDGYVYVGSLKVQIVDNLFRCPQENCNKNFRKENHLQIHVKHYHRELAKLLGVCPNMQDLACKRTIGTVSEEPLPKNHLPNVQFFAKLHQQDIASKTHRKSIASATAPPILSPDASIEGNKTDLLEMSTTSLNSEITTPTIDTSKISQSSKTKSTSMLSSTPIEQKQFEIGKDVTHRTPLKSLKSHEHKPTSTKMKKSNVKNTFNNRKSSRQKLSKKYIKSGALSSSRMISNTPTTSTNIDGSSDQEETRHSFNGNNSTAELGKSLKRFKPEPLSFVSDTNLLDVTSQSQTTTGSLQESSQSPKYISENGEIIKIVRMKQEEIINCLCSFGEEDGLMIQCELCLCWQHGICNGIEKESQVPEKYICYICRNPQRGRSSLKYIHDQDWMYEGKLPVASYHASNPNLDERFDVLRKTHVLTGNLLEFKKFFHSLRVKINIADNKDHPKMYLWTNKWESSSPTKNLKAIDTDKTTNENVGKKEENEQKDDLKNPKKNELNLNGNEDNKKNCNVTEANTLIQPTIPQPEAPIDPVECQNRLLDHIRNQQTCAMDRLQTIESQVLELDSLDNTEIDRESDDYSKTKEIIAMYIKDLETMKNIAKINTIQVQSNVAT